MGATFTNSSRTVFACQHPSHHLYATHIGPGAPNIILLGPSPREFCMTSVYPLGNGQNVTQATVTAALNSLDEPLCSHTRLNNPSIRQLALVLLTSRSDSNSSERVAAQVFPAVVIVAALHLSAILSLQVVTG
ncbi:uncharacterized protein BDZ99DRAFT_231937 [Mytilinidion resinicola]|uniref:Uncharacterized protein n=1 Tax=Mytilinidion resinicola TaxID=574789 RepID=A0A6A6YYX0_9PEZI|nr:uncharacterized protein BDZ99DRAFT_231937 [Mytilinidion resinicola]KAF2814136.1 hypothetical protein BDZ99DRAFT_231937 [Mytilinidion resinicola]